MKKIILIISILISTLYGERITIENENNKSSEIVGTIKFDIKYDKNFIEAKINRGILRINDKLKFHKGKIDYIRICIGDHIEKGWDKKICSQKYIIDKKISKKETLVLKQYQFIIPQKAIKKTKSQWFLVEIGYTNGNKRSKWCYMHQKTREDSMEDMLPTKALQDSMESCNACHKAREDSKLKPLYQIYYGTNRKPNNPKDHSEGYGNERASKLHTGICKVYIPESHKVGEITGSWRDKLIHLDSSYGDIRLKIIKNYKNEAELWSELQKLFSTSSERKEALIFIHGYNNSFKDAAIRAAQMGYDLGVKGVTAFYSWPSENDIDKYLSDEATIQASEKYIKQFIRGFAQNSGASKVHIIAHSMGNRGLLRAINDIQKETPNIRFGQIILAAPDVDADLFKDISNAYIKLSERTTIYASPDDKAIAISKAIHDNPRVGIIYPVIKIEKIDTIVVNFDFSLFGLFKLGHAYFAKEKKILKDITSLLENNTSISNRPEIKKIYPEGREWHWSLPLD